MNLEETLETLRKEQKLSIDLISGGDVEAFKELLLEGTEIESRNKGAMEELLSVFRFTQWDKNKYAYGLTLTDIPSLLSPFIQPIVKYTSRWDTFGEQSIKSFTSRLEKETVTLIITIRPIDTESDNSKNIKTPRQDVKDILISH